MRQFFYYKMRQFYYKMRQLLQIATTLLKNATFITNCDSTVIYTTTEIFTFSLKLNHYYKDV